MSGPFDRQWIEQDPVEDVNDRDFFSDDNMDALAEPASYSDWGPGPNESAQGVRGRPLGDGSAISYDEIESA